MEAIYIFDHSIFSGMVQTSENTGSAHNLTKKDQIVQENDEPYQLKAAKKRLGTRNKSDFE